MMRVLLTLILLIVVGFLPGCQKEDPEIRDKAYPVLLTELGDVTRETATLGGKFLSKGTSEIREVGFLVGTERDRLEDTITIDTIADEFQYQLNEGIVEGRGYYFKAYAINETHTALGNTLSFICGGSMPNPTVESFSPSEGTDGTVITVNGTNFSSNSENMSVHMDNHPCEILYANSDSLSFKIPVLSAGSIMATLQVYDSQVSFGPIEIRDPEIDDFNPKEGIDGTTVTITGNFFGESPKVFFGEDEGTVLEYSNTLIEVRSPDTEHSGDVDIIVDVSGKVTHSSEKYTIVTHQITGLSETAGNVGDLLIIYGENFLQGGSNPTVYFNETYARIYQADQNMIYVWVPIVEEGQYLIKVTNGGKEDTYSGEFTVIGSWEELEGFPGTAMDAPVSIALNSYGYLGLGVDGEIYSGALLTEWWRFDPTDLSWTRLADFPGESSYEKESFALDNKIYVVLGNYEDGSGILHLDLWEYDPGTDGWIRKDSTIAGNNNFLYASACAYEGKAYLQTGDLLLVYDPAADSWETRGFTIPEEMDLTVTPFCFNLSEKIYWFFGSHYNLLLYEYEPGIDQWLFIRRVDELEAGVDHVTFTVNGKGYFGGGRWFGEANPGWSLFYEFDPLSLTFIEKERFYRECARQAAFGIGDKGYVGLGVDVNLDPQSDFWIFDP